MSAEVVDDVVQGVGAYVMGRKMLGGGPGPWDESWCGWWETSRPSTSRSISSRTIRASRSRCRAGRRSRSSPTGSSPRWSRHAAPPAGERLLENVGNPVLEPVEVVASPAVTHVKYRVVR